MASAVVSKTVIGMFDDMNSAENAVRELEQAGYSRSDISVVAPQGTGGPAPAGVSQVSTSAATNEATDKTAHVASDAGIGAALGGVGGLLLSFAGLAVPGIGPVLAVGPIVAALSGAGIGAVAGGVIGALTEAGVPGEEAQYYAEGLRRGHVLVTVRTNDDNVERVQDILDANGAVDVEGRASGWRERGWSGHDPGAEPLSADELRREREYYQAFASERVELEREEREQRPTGSTMEGATLEGTRWPHRDAHDVGESLAAAEASNAALDKDRTSATPEPASTAYRDTAAVIGETSRPLRSDIESPSNFSDAIENNRRRPDPAVVQAERGFERAKDSAVRSAKRIARVYEGKSR